MGLSEIFQKKEVKKPQGRVNHIFSDADRQKAKSRRQDASRFRNEIKKRQNELDLLDLEYQKRQRIKQIKEIDQPLIPVDYDPEDDYEDPEDDYEDPEDEDPLDSKMLSMFEKILAPRDQAPAIVNAPVELTPDQIVAQIPADKRAMLKKMSPEKIKELASLYYPDIPPTKVDAIIPLL